MKTSPIALALLAAAGFASAALPAPLAKIDGEPVTAEDVLAELTKLHGVPAKLADGEGEARKALDEVIDRRLLIREAYRLGLDRREDIRKSVDAFGETKALEYLLRKEIDEKAEPTQAEVREAWKKNTSLQYELRIIEVPTREEATAVYLDALSGKSFEGLARSCSIARSRMYGGKLPPVGWGTLDPAVEAAAFALEPGDTAPPVKSSSGWDVVRMEGIDAVERPEFEAVKAKIEGILRKRELEARRAAFSDYLFAKFHVKTADVVRTPSALAEALEKTPDSAVASWDGGALPLRDFVSRNDAAVLARIPPSRAGELVEQRLRRALDDRLARREAKERGIEKLPEVAGEVRDRREELMEEALDAASVAAVTDADVRAEFDAHPAGWTTPERRRVAQILVDTEEEALAAKKRLDAGEAFGEVARQVSIDAQSKNTGGDLGWITKKNVPAAFSAVLTIPVGAVTGPIRSKFGWHLIKVIDVQPGKPLKFEAAKEQVKERLIDRRKAEARAERVKKLRAAATIEIDDARVREFAKGHSLD